MVLGRSGREDEADGGPSGACMAHGQAIGAAFRRRAFLFLRAFARSGDQLAGGRHIGRLNSFLRAGLYGLAETPDAPEHRYRRCCWRFSSLDRLGSRDWPHSHAPTCALRAYLFLVDVSSELYGKRVLVRVDLGGS